MGNSLERFVYVVTDNWQKISVNITNSPWSDRAEIDFLADQVLAQGYEIIMEGVEEFCEEY